MRMLSLSLSACEGCRGPPRATGKVMVDTAYGSPIGTRTTFATCRRVFTRGGIHHTQRRSPLSRMRIMLKNEITVVYCCMAERTFPDKLKHKPSHTAHLGWREAHVQRGDAGSRSDWLVPRPHHRRSPVIFIHGAAGPGAGGICGRSVVAVCLSRLRDRDAPKVPEIRRWVRTNDDREEQG